MNNLYTNVDETNQIDTTLDNITIVHCQGEHFQAMKHLLNHIFPNTRHLILSYTSTPIAFSSLQKYDEYFRDKWMTADYIYSSTIQYIEIKMTLMNTDCIDQHVIHLVKELLKIFKNLQSFIFHFYHCPRFPSTLPFTELSKTIQLLKREKFAEIYQIKHIHHYLQFVRENNQYIILLFIQIKICSNQENYRDNIELYFIYYH
jgi:hypothetical protein